MTEAEWQTATDAHLMLEFVKRKVSDRKLRLFVVACCRCFWAELQSEATRHAIETNERFADLQATGIELGRARSGAHSAAWQVRYEIQSTALTPDGKVVTQQVAGRPGVSDEYLRRMYFVAFMANPPDRLRADEIPMLRTDPVLRQNGPFLLRDVVGPHPFRPVAIDPSWRTSAVVGLAQGIYDERAFERMPVLADALEDAGCDDAAVLDHCRGDGPHARGCWVVDAILGKK